MTDIMVEKDFDNLTLIVAADYDVPVERAWQLWADPRQLERWWGPPMYPSTVETHDLTPGGQVTYFMTGPEGDVHRGWWSIVDVDAPRRLVLDDGFADDTGTPNLELPVMRMTLEISDRPGGVTMTTRSVYASLEAMEQVLAMGMEEGLRAAMGQIDGILYGASAV
jgi:uncharacterized protein YndB with AHSA1/START domain